MSVCFPCGPIQLSVACVRPSKHVFVVLGIFVSIFGDVFGVLAIGKSVTYSTHPIVHNMDSLCARVSLFEGDVQVSVCRSLKLLRAVVARGCSEFARLSVGRGVAVRLCHATSTFRMHVVVCSLFCSLVVECNLCSKHNVRFVFHIFDETLMRIHIQMNSKLITSIGH